MRWLLVLVCAGAALAEEPVFEKAEPAADLAPGKNYEGVSRSKRPYWYRLPAAIDKESPPDLVFMLHGTGMSYKWGFYNYGVHEGHFRPRDIVVSPESEDPNRGFVQGKADRDEIVALIKLFRKAFPVRHVYLYGHSQGAFFCYYFAGEKPDLIDGIVAHAGNFFKAKTAKAARENVAIGILHGRADAVVTVECAFATDLVYRGDGYANVKLWVVDGLTEQSGHWPLPFHVQRMLAWCDLVSADTAANAAALVKSEIGREEPDWVMVARAAVRARALGAPGMDAVVAAAQAHAAELAKADTSAYGPWCAHWQLANEAFAGLPEWEEAVKPLQPVVKKHTKAVEKGMKAIRKNNKKSFAGGLEALEHGYAGVGYPHLADHVKHRFLNPGDRVSDKDRARYEALQAARKAADDAGRKAFFDLAAAQLAALK